MNILTLRNAKLHFPWGKPCDEGHVLWRVECNSYAYVIDAERELYGFTDPRLEALYYPIRKRTPCGAWIEDRFVNLKANKRYATNTLAEALESFTKRKERQVSILSANLKEAQDALDLVNYIKASGY